MNTWIAVEELPFLQEPTETFPAILGLETVR
jgi:hypothetical protein